MADILKELQRKEVIVYSMGVQYKGTLIEVNESEIYLRTQAGWVTIPMDRVSSIKKAQSLVDFSGNSKY